MPASFIAQPTSAIDGIFIDWRTEMRKLLAILAVSLMAAGTAQAAEFADVDSDEDGMITMEEAQSAMPELSEESFTQADADGDGTLNAEEFASLSE